MQLSLRKLCRFDDVTRGNQKSQWVLQYMNTSNRLGRNEIHRSKSELVNHGIISIYPMLYNYNIGYDRAVYSVTCHLNLTTTPNGGNCEMAFLQRNTLEEVGLFDVLE